MSFDSLPRANAGQGPEALTPALAPYESERPWCYLMSFCRRRMFDISSSLASVMALVS